MDIAKNKTTTNISNNPLNIAAVCFALGKKFFDSKINDYYTAYYNIYNINKTNNEISCKTLNTAIKYISNYNNNLKKMLPLITVKDNYFIFTEDDGKKYLICDDNITEYINK